VKSILFVCTGNTCRSPMAEAILRNKKLEGIEARSAGIYAADGSEASTNAKIVLEEKNIQHDHRSSLLTAAEVRWADLILTMTASHKHKIQQQFPEAVMKVFTLKEYTGEPFDHDVFDPYGGSLSMYEETYRELEALIDKAVGKIKSSGE